MLCPWARRDRPARLPPRTSADNRRQARSHWNVGIIHFQRGDYTKARGEWLLCQNLDPANADCATGRRRIDTTYGP